MSTIKNVLKVYESSELPPYTVLRDLASKPDADFSAISPNTKRNVFHKCVDDNAIHRLKAIFEGFIQGNRQNQSIKKAIDDTYNGKTPLFMAVEGNMWMKTEYKQRLFVEIFLALGANRNLSYQGKKPEEVAKATQVPNAFKQNLSQCLEAAHFGVCRIRIQSLDTNDSLLSFKDDISGDNYILLAIKAGKKKKKTEDKILEIVKLLIEKGIKVNDPNYSLQTPLELAVRDGYAKIVEYLVSTAHADLSRKYTDGNTIIHIAAECAKDDVKILDFLLKQDKTGGVFANQLNIANQTPLYFVCNEYAVDSLCLQGKAKFKSEIPKESKKEDVKDSKEKDSKSLKEEDIKDSLGNTPIKHALQKRLTKIAERIEVYHPDTTKERIKEISEKNSWTIYLTTKIWEFSRETGQMVAPVLIEGLKTALVGVLTVTASAVVGGVKNYFGIKET